MKKFLSLILTVMLTLSVVMGIAVYAEPSDADTQTQQDAQDAQDTQNADASTPDDSMYHEDTIEQYIVLDFTKNGGDIEYKGIITGDDSSIEYVKQLYKQYYSQDLEDTNMDDKPAVIVNNSTVTKEELPNLGLGYIEETGLFGTKTTYFYIDATGSTNYEDGKKIATIRFVMPSRPSYCKNAKIVKNTVEKDILSGENNSVMFSIYKANIINILIFVMILIVLILAIILIYLKTKNKKAREVFENTDDEITRYEVPGEVTEEVKEEKTEEASEEKTQETAQPEEETKEEKETDNNEE